MPTDAQVRGMLLEEAALYLLRWSGYTPVTGVGNDSTLRPGPAGLYVKGRGEDHQIDAIADYLVQQPFANPSRLLLEAKFRPQPAGIEVVRNGVGVLKDVSEYWATGGAHAQLPRYHYQYAILASSGFSAGAQRYAVAQDVYLIPFAGNSFFQPVLRAIEGVTAQDAEAVADGDAGRAAGSGLARLRRCVRSALLGVNAYEAFDNNGGPLPVQTRAVVEAAMELRYSLLAVAIQRVPLVLTPAEGVELAQIRGVMEVHIYWDEEGWYLTESVGGERRLFSFDLPRVLFDRYAEQDELSPERALNLKENELSRIDAVIVEGETVRSVRFVLDHGWIERLRRDRDGRAPRV